MTATRSAAALSGTGAYGGIYDVTAAPYSAVGDGTTDDTTAIQAAITAAKAAGGTVFFPPRTYKVTAALVCGQNARGYRITGAASGMGDTGTLPTLLFTQSGSGACLQCHSIIGVEIDHIRIQYSNASYTGDVIDVDGNPHASDCTLWHIHHIQTAGVGGTPARSSIRLNKAIIGAIDHCNLTGAVNQIRAGDPGGSYVVTVAIENNTYNFSSNAHILLGSGDAEAISIRGETFEAGTNTPGIRATTIALDGSGAQLYSPSIERCWFGDAGAATTWIKDLAVTSQLYMGTIRGNFFASNSTGTHMILSGAWVIAENSTQDGAAFLSWGGGTSCPVALMHNFINNATAVFAAGTRPSNAIMIGNVGAGVTPASELNDVLQSRLAFGSGTAFTLGETGGKEQLLLGVNPNGGGLVALGSKAGVYAAGGFGSTPGILALQAPTSGSPNEVQLIGGATPAAVLRVGDATLGFYNHAPVARTAAYTLNAGATARNLPAAGTTLDVEKALRQLITDLQANGLLQ